ncbi:hypothetical protein GCM10022280_01240 [Sphingomonas swuensis]|uniref:Uncharacterized protein n=1 Tax=Sphingomonas swuensis TaxID=977800 RepID=A0ABP7S8G3_9SPHN
MESVGREKLGNKAVSTVCQQPHGGPQQEESAESLSIIPVIHRAVDDLAACGEEAWRMANRQPETRAVGPSPPLR